ncbi:MAG: DUF3054 domain-containing protein [Acidimicrobiales bacterium]|nr:DUF3054 domain-containing protein [Acidimicrobiales bacterium]
MANPAPASSPASAPAPSSPGTGERRAPVWLPPLLDLACLLAFVWGGRSSHGIDGDGSWFLEVLWPFAVGWYAVALAARLYTARTQRLARLAAVWVIGLPVAWALRAVALDRPFFTTFLGVSAAFIVATTGGWRLVGLGLGRLRRR